MKKRTLKELQVLREAGNPTAAKLPLVLVLDNVRSALNTGSAFRTADAFAIEKIVLCGITATPPHREILKTAIGATETVAWEYAADTVAAIRALQTAGYRVWAVEQAEGSQLLQDLVVPLASPIALVFGNEVSGVSDEAMAAVNGCVEVPQFGTKHSLNIAVCLGVVVWEVVRQLRFGS